MSQKIITQGVCKNCKDKVNLAKAKQHIQFCFAQNPLEPHQANTFLVKVQWPHRNPIYWIYLAVPFERTLSDLDFFLRELWLECCGHLSQFTIQQERYTSDSEYANSRLQNSELSMNIKVGKILRPSLKFIHEYDYGSTTELLLEVMDLLKLVKPKEIELLMQNENPLFKCSSCGNQATLCYDMEYFCEECGEEQEYVLPLANSPRTGVCGYH